MKKILLVIDPQNDFIWGSLAVDGAREAIKKLALSLASDRIYDQVIITADMHPDNHCSFIENGGQWPAHCVRHTEGCQINSQLRSVVDVLYPGKYLILDKGLDAEREEYSILKNATSMKRLLPFINDADEIHICGIAGDFCVLETVKDLVRLGYGSKIVLLWDFIAHTDKGYALTDLTDKEKLSWESTLTGRVNFE